MQQVQTRRLDSNSHSIQYAWQNDEEAFISALMNMAQDQHVGRWNRIKVAAVGLLNATGMTRLFGR